MRKFVYQAFLEPDEDGGYCVEFPDLPGCLTSGDDYMDAAAMAADAGKTYIASMLAHGDAIPLAARHNTPSGCESIYVFFEVDENYLVEGDVVSAAQAARDLGVSPGRITHMIDAGQLDAYRQGRRTFVSVASIERRKRERHPAGRPRKSALEA